MAQITRSTKISGGSTLSSNTLARAADVETDVLTLFNAHNNHDTGSSKWQVVSTLNSSSVPLVVDNSTGSQDIAQFKNNGTTVWNITSAGVLTSNSKKITGLPDGTSTGDAVRYDQLAVICKYRRPVLQYNSGTVVNVETGINGTSGQLQILFPDFTIRTDSTTTRIQCNLAQVAALTVTAQSGLRTGALVNNTWYALYAVKSQVNTTDIVIVADTVLPIQANYATLNANFGTNSWVYLGMARYGDQSATANAILAFSMVGNLTLFGNKATGNAGNCAGIRLATTAGATSLTYTLATGTSGAVFPNNILAGSFITAAISPNTGTTAIVQDTSASGYVLAEVGTGLNSSVIRFPWNGLTGTEALYEALTSAESRPMDFFLSGFYDGVLGVGVNPLL